MPYNLRCFDSRNQLRSDTEINTKYTHRRNEKIMPNREYHTFAFGRCAIVSKHVICWISWFFYPSHRQTTVALTPDFEVLR